MTEPWVPPPTAPVLATPPPPQTSGGFGEDAATAVPGPRRPAVAWPVVAAFGAWSTFVWGTRIYNIWSDVLLSTEEKALLTVIALVFVGLGIGAFFVGISLRRWFPNRTDVVAVGVLGGWTLGVWASRVLDITLGGDHGPAFIIVHVVLAIVSVGLAAWSWMVIAAARDQGAEDPTEPAPMTSASSPPLVGSVPQEGQR